MSIRDLLSWVNFINTVLNKPPRDQQSNSRDLDLEIASAYVHGACLVFLDALAAQPSSGRDRNDRSRNSRHVCVNYVINQVQQLTSRDITVDVLGLAIDAADIDRSSRNIIKADNQFGIELFFIASGQCKFCSLPFYSSDTELLAFVHLVIYLNRLKCQTYICRIIQKAV